MALSRTLSDLLEQDKIAKFTKTGSTTATLGSLTFSTAISGAGGLDTGTIAASTFYYVYTVVSSNAVKLVASTSATSPTGFTQYKKVGAFYTDSSSNIFKAYFYGEVNLTVLSAKISSTGVVSGENTDWLSGNFSNPTTGTYNGTINSGVFSLIPNGVATCEGGVGSPNTAMLNIVSTTALSAFLRNNSNGVQSSTWNLVCQKQGVDATMPDWSRI